MSIKINAFFKLENVVFGNFSLKCEFYICYLNMLLYLCVKKHTYWFLTNTNTTKRRKHKEMIQNRRQIILKRRNTSEGY